MRWLLVLVAFPLLAQPAPEEIRPAWRLTWNPATDCYPPYTADPLRSRHIIGIVNAFDSELPDSENLRWGLRNKPLRLQTGLELEGNARFGTGRPYAAIDLTSFEENDYEVSANAIALESSSMTVAPNSAHSSCSGNAMPSLGCGWTCESSF